MKTALVVLSSFIITFTFVLRSLPVVAGATPDPVLDTSGRKLRCGTNYYILPLARGSGGGLTVASIGNKTYHVAIAQEQRELTNGLPLTFATVNTKKGVVRLSTDLNIKFSATITYVQSTVWKVDSYDKSLRQWFVTTGGVEGNPCRETSSNWFKIEKCDGEYKLVFCPSVSDYYKVLCKDIGIYVENGIRRLALSDTPFKVMFKKA